MRKKKFIPKIPEPHKLPYNVEFMFVADDPTYITNVLYDKIRMPRILSNLISSYFEQPIYHVRDKNNKDLEIDYVYDNPLMYDGISGKWLTDLSRKDYFNKNEMITMSENFWSFGSLLKSINKLHSEIII